VSSSTFKSSKAFNKAHGCLLGGVIGDAMGDKVEGKDYRSIERDHGWIACDSRETVPIALSIFYLAGGDVAKAIPYAANFGRDADTIATIAGAVAGAFGGSEAIPVAWRVKAESYSDIDQRELAAGLIEAAFAKLGAVESAASSLRAIAGNE